MEEFPPTPQGGNKYRRRQGEECPLGGRSQRVSCERVRNRKCPKKWEANRERDVEKTLGEGVYRRGRFKTGWW